MGSLIELFLIVAVIFLYITSEFYKGLNVSLKLILAFETRIYFNIGFHLHNKDSQSDLLSIFLDSLPLGLLQCLNQNKIWINRNGLTLATHALLPNWIIETWSVLSLLKSSLVFTDDIERTWPCQSGSRILLLIRTMHKVVFMGSLKVCLGSLNRTGSKSCIATIFFI